MANTRPHQLLWGDQEMGTAISCTKCSWMASLIHITVESSLQVVANVYLHSCSHSRGVGQAERRRQDTPPSPAAGLLSCQMWGKP